VIINYGDVSKLSGHHWYYLELRNESTIEATLKRICEKTREIMGLEPIQIFVPVKERNFRVFDTGNSNYLLVRSKDLRRLAKYVQITSVLGLLTRDGSNYVMRALPVEDKHVQALITADRARFYRDQGIALDSFVRILSGITKDYCGTVVELNGEAAVVRVDLKINSLLVTTSIRNLLNLSHVPAERRVFYHTPLVEELGDVALIEPDLKVVEEVPKAEDLEAALESAVFHRAQVATNIVREAIAGGMTDPFKVAEHVLKGVKEGKIKPTKNCFILYNIIKDALAKHYRATNPELKFADWRKIAAKLDIQFRLKDVAELGDDSGVPKFTAECDIAQDGRQRRKWKRKQ
jgi:hypothetical protein